MVSEKIFKVFPIISLWELYVPEKPQYLVQPLPLPDDVFHEILLHLANSGHLEIYFC